MPPTTTNAPSTWGELLGGGVGGLLGALALYENLGNIKEDRSRIRGDIYGASGPQFGEGGLMGYLGRESQFVPSTVRSRIGQTTYDPTTGQTGYDLSGEQQAQSDLLRGGATDFYNQAMQPIAGRETDIYNRIRAMQMPEEQRQYDSMNANLFGSGRGGMFTSAFGGSPEQFAFSKGQAEARNTAGFQAMQQAQQERQNLANLGQQYQTNQFMPYGQLGSQMGQGIQMGQVANQAAQARAGMLGQLGLGGMTTDVNLSNVYAGLLGDIAQALGAAGSGVGGGLFNEGGLFNR